MTRHVVLQSSDSAARRPRRLAVLAACIALTLAKMPADAADPRVVVDRGLSPVEMWLAATVQVALFAEPRVSGGEVGDIALEVEGGGVTLRGLVDSAAAWHAASAVVSRLPGVTSVSNELRIVPATVAIPRDDARLARDVAAALRATGELEGARMSVVVGDGMVHLSGSVLDVSDWALASRTARDVVGVRAVANRLRIDRLGLAAE